ncbi:MAG: FAD-dependent oxidoreductase [Candidatus Bathyarchaeia archaeon]|jgi:NADH-dependent peroxiredoxin subunit F
MSKVIDEETKAQLQEILNNLISPVRLVFFTQKNACPACEQQLELLKDLSSLSSKLELTVYDFVLHGDEAMSYKIDKIPATAVIGKRDYGIRFYGLTAGYEFSSLIQAILMVSTGSSGLDPQLEELVKSIKEQVHLQVMVTLTCPYCPRMVHVADQFALVNQNIRADMVEASEFPQLAQRYNVTGVPKTIINEAHSFEGAIPAGTVYMEILKAVSPEEYKRLEEAIREIQDTRKTGLAEEKHEYEVIIVGGGPAAMSAAIYSARKGLDVALIAKKLGGQIEYTATVENYLGMPNVSGADLAEAFRGHLEGYPIAEALGSDVVMIRKTDDSFVVLTDDDRQFRARSVIYCAGKEYNRLGVPGEEQFIGKGIGFCATCDAPLYRDKRVAVVGGGNSAFTSARDLLSFASEVHLIHRRKEFKADAALVQEVLKVKNLTVHTDTVVRSFLGKDKLTGVRLESVDGKDRFDLNVDGVFLEIGLNPNTSPLKALVELNKRGEVPVSKDQSTTIKGLFAAGDVTDVEEKQISIAVGQGALAALAAHKYLVQNHLTNSKIGPKEQWE